MALGAALGIATMTAADVKAGEADAKTGLAKPMAQSTNAVVLANAILDKWEAVAMTVGAQAAWRDVMFTQLSRMDISVLNFVNGVAVPASGNPKAAYAPFADAIRSALMQTYMQGESGKGTMKLGSTTNDQVFLPIVPCRIVDTRNVGGAISAGATRNFYYYTDTGSFSWSNQGGAPYPASTGAATTCPGTVNPGNTSTVDGAAAAAVMTVTVVSPTAAGNFILWGGGSPIPTASALNWSAGQVLANTTIVPWGSRTGSNLDFAVLYNGPSGSAHFVADVVGYMVENHATALDCITTTNTDTPIPANGVITQANATACPTGYTHASVLCSTGDAAGVYLMETGVNGSLSCSWSNLSANAANGIVRARCCRVPGQ